MSKRERQICNRAKMIMKLQRWAHGRGSFARQVPAQLQEPGFLSWLGGHLQSIGESAGDLAMWIGRNTLRAWELYRTYQQLTGGGGGVPIPLSGLTSGFNSGGGGGGVVQSFAGGSMPGPRLPGLPAPPPTNGGRSRNGSGTNGGTGTRTRTGRSTGLRSGGSSLTEQATRETTTRTQFMVR